MLWICLLVAAVTAWALLSVIGNERQQRLNELEIKILLAARKSSPRK